MPLPEGPGTDVSVDCVGPLPVTPRGNTYILLSTDRFNRLADMFAVTAAEVTAEGTASILINRYVLRWGCRRSIHTLSDNSHIRQYCKTQHTQKSTHRTENRTCVLKHYNTVLFSSILYKL